MKLENDWKLLLMSIKEIQDNGFESDLPDNLLKYLIAGEDHRYCYHLGVDPISLVRAFWRSNFCNRREGGSTIAMQLVRTLTKDYKISLKRKIKEAYLATRLTLYFDSKFILKMYLSVAYFGWNMHGINQACKKLKLDIKSLNDYDAAALIARLKYPEPRHGNEKKIIAIHTRANYIINRSNHLNIQGIYGTI